MRTLRGGSEVEQNKYEHLTVHHKKIHKKHDQLIDIFVSTHMFSLPNCWLFMMSSIPGGRARGIGSAEGGDGTASNKVKNSMAIKLTVTTVGTVADVTITIIL